MCLARLARVRAECVGERARLEYPGVLREEAEQQPGEEDVEVVHGGVGLDAVVSNDLVVELGHLLGGLAIGVVEVLELGLLEAGPGSEERRVWTRVRRP